MTSDDDVPTVGRAEDDELPRVVALHLAQLPFPSNVLSCLGDRVVRCAYRWFASDPRAALLVARRGDSVVGFTSLAAGSYLTSLVRRCPGALTLGLLTRPGVLAHREVRERVAALLPRGSRASASEERWAQVAFTVVAPEARGEGVAARLKAAGAAVARTWGVDGLVTGVRRDNAASRRMNERAGFVADESAGSSSTVVYRYRFPSTSETDAGRR